MSKLLKNFVGIDISKPFFDVAVLKTHQPTQTLHRQFKQSLRGFQQFKEWLTDQGVLLNEETLFCMEHTGIYNTALVSYLCENNSLVWVEMAMKIKRSEGFVRSSTDKNDAISICKYAFRYQDRQQLWKPVDASLNKIKHLIAQRDRIVESISRLTVPVNELKEIGCIDEARQMEKLQKGVIRNLEKMKKNIEATISKNVDKDKELSLKVERVKSIKGIGQVTAIACLVYTRGFTSFKTAKQLACYSGVAPFTKKQSGISIRSKAHVSSFANHKLKRLLHLCALSAIRYDKELKTYYERKLSEGKKEMSVINAVRNKLILRIFAVLRDERDFVENYTRNVHNPMKNKPLLNLAAS
jgi:transposase